jgi:hypothetical protein
MILDFVGAEELRGACVRPPPCVRPCRSVNVYHGRLRWPNRDGSGLLQDRRRRKAKDAVGGVARACSGVARHGLIEGSGLCCR